MEKSNQRHLSNDSYTRERDTSSLCDMDRLYWQAFSRLREKTFFGSYSQLTSGIEEKDGTGVTVTKVVLSDLAFTNDEINGWKIS